MSPATAHRGTNNKDPDDPRQVATAALRSAASTPTRADDHAAVLKVRAKRHQGLSRSRNQVVCRLHARACHATLSFIPLFIIWLGIGELPKEVLIIIGIIPIMAVTTVAALDEVPEDLRLCARTLGASRRYTLLHVQIRAALPGILTGMRISMAAAWSSIAAVELMAATSGLGFMIMQAGNYLDSALVFSAITMIAVAGLTLDACLRWLLILADPSRRR